MQATDNLSVSRRTLDVEDYIDIARRHRGWIFGPFLFTLVAAVVGVYLYPDSYQSQAVVKIVPQQLPQNMVPSEINQQLSDRINSMAQSILSRATLTTMINSFGLYPREKTRMPMEDVIEQMKRKIKITPIQAAPGDHIPAFVVSFSYDNRYLAQKVVQDLVTRFIDENIRDRSQIMFGTSQFLKDQVDQSKKELDEAEGRVASFRMQNNGRLPDQMMTNMQTMSAVQQQVTYLNSQMSRVSQEKLQMESNLRILKDQLSAVSKEPLDSVAIQRNEKVAEADREITNWENQLSVLRQHYKENYPDVQTAVQRLEAARARKAQVLKEDTQEKADNPAPRIPNQNVVRESRELDANIRRLQTALEGKDMEVAEYEKEMKRANEAIRNLQGRIENVPLGEKQYADLLRDRDLAKEKYLDLQVKLSRAEIAADMEGRKQGETLETLDPASLPATPSEPKRPMIISAGAGLGFLLGLVIAGAREVKDTSLKNLKDVRAYTQMPILGSVPLLENDFVVRRRRRLAWLGWTTASLAAVVIMAGSVVYYYVTKV